MRLVELQNEITYEKNKECVGKTAEVLVEQKSLKDENCVCGRGSDGRMINFPADSKLIGSVVKVLITEGKKKTLFGKLL